MKIYTDRTKLKFSSEIMILIGILNKYPNEPIHCINHRGRSRYYPLLEYCKENIEYTDNILLSTIVILPYKFKNTDDPYYKNLVELCRENNRKLLCFYNDDDDKTFNIDKNVILFRTSFYRSKKKINEKALTAFTPDFFNDKFLIEPILSIGYCGHTLHNRKRYLWPLLKSKLKTNFILRSGFWAPRIERAQAVIEFNNNISSNLFTFCYRGAGNFSYRFYQVLMMGRIPILVNTDCVFPFEEKYDLYSLGVIIDEEDLLNGTKNIIEETKKYYFDNKNNLLKIQKRNRKIWEKYFSPVGFCKNLVTDFKT